MMFLGILIGLFIGGCIGVSIMAVVAVGSSADDEMEKDEKTERKGKWIKSDIPNEEFVCSECGGACWYYDYRATVKKSFYCPNCGAKMEEDGE